jgi:hypothetical protein
MNNDEYKNATCISHMQTKFCEMTDFVTSVRKIAGSHDRLSHTVRVKRATPRKPSTLPELFVTESPRFVIS